VIRVATSVRPSMWFRPHPSLKQSPLKPSVADRWTQGTLVSFACFVALLVLLFAFFSDRNGDVDELAMYNPAYMLAHFGKLTFPSYSHRTYMDLPVIVHPPVHLGLIGLLGRLGFTWYYAEATPTAALFLLSILVIVRGAFPAPVKLGLLFSIGFLMLNGGGLGLTFGTRPEGALQAAWFLGLLLLESGRLDNWSNGKLFMGAFMLTWASTIHYYAAMAFTGVAVYLVWAVVSLGWKDAKSRLVALCAGGCLFGIPYLGFYLLPHYKVILNTIQAVQGSGGTRASVLTHFKLYREMSRAYDLPAIVTKPLGLGIPLAIVATAVLALIRSTRGLALAALPLQVFIFFFASHKWSLYLLHEIAIFTAAMAVGVLVLGDYVLRRVAGPRVQRIFFPAAASLLFLYLIAGNPTLRAVTISTEPRVHEGDVARAAGRIILGPHASVAGRYGAWYTSGAASWWDIETDMLGPSPYDPVKFFGNFDAVVDYPHMSDISSDGTISSWYAQGALKLRGFYFGETNEQLQLVLLSARPVPQVVGYAARNGQVYRFEEHPTGDYQVISAVCPQAPELEYGRWQYRWAGTFSTIELLPKPVPDASVLVTVLTAHSPEPAGWIGRSCKEIAKIDGSLLLADRKAMVEGLRREDTPMTFPRALEQVPGFIEAGLPADLTPPKDTILLSKVLRVSDLQPSFSVVRVDPGPPIRITTPLSGGSFAAGIPVLHGDSVVTPCWVELRLRVISGRIGFAVFNSRSGILTRTNAAVLKSIEPEDVVLKAPDLRGATHVIIFNDGSSPGQFEVLDAAVLVSQQDWERNKTQLSAVR
jgi:hypothetical protein